MNASEMARALLLAIDPETALDLPPPHSGQQTVIADAQRFNVLAAGRRWGKNTLAEGCIVLPALQGKPVAWLSPTYKTLADDWRRLSDILLPVAKSKNEQERRIVLTTGGLVDMWSLESPDTARGRAYARVVIDEAASVPHLLYAWQNVIRPMLTDFSGDAWFISTPNGFNDFHELYQWGQDPGRPEWRSWRRPSSENPHLPAEDLAQAERDLVPRVWQQEYLAMFLAGGIGQFFSEWDPAVHICKPFDPPGSWRRFGMLDYGYVSYFCYLQGALSPDGQGYITRELYRSRVLDSDQATPIADTCQKDPPEYIVAGPDLWNPSGKGPKGQSTAETYQEVWRKRDFRTHLKMAANDRIQGWRRVREWLKPYVGPDGRQTALLQIMEGRAPNLVRALPGLVHDEGKPEDVNSDGEDHAPDSLRYGLMSRPRPAHPKPVSQASDFDGAAIYKMVNDRRKRAQYIGTLEDERFSRYLHFARFLGPSDT
jgi:hypothetical protein